MIGLIILFGTASYIGVKEYVPPYLDSTLTTAELMTGVSFASGGTGYDPLTPRISVSLSLSSSLSIYICVCVSVAFCWLRYKQTVSQFSL